MQVKQNPVEIGSYPYDVQNHNNWDNIFLSKEHLNQQKRTCYYDKLMAQVNFVTLV